MSDAVAEAIREGFGMIAAELQSPNVSDSNGENANLVDTTSGIAGSLRAVAGAIRCQEAASGTDATGGTISSLTEACMGITAGLMAIATSIDGLANAIQDHGS